MRRPAVFTFSSRRSPRIRRAILPPLVLSAALLGAAGCHGLSDALTAHVDVAAHASGSELSVTRLATLAAHSRAPLQKEFVRQIALLWVDYQLLGRAAALGDSLNQPKLEDAALWPILANAKSRHLVDTLTKHWLAGDSAQYPARYAKGDALAAWHILISPPKGDTAAAALDSTRRKAAVLRAHVTPANFADLAKKNSQDPGSATKGGDLGVFGKGQMVPQFEQALLALPPGQISQPVKTQFGYHVIYRPTYAQVHEKFDKMMHDQTLQHAESLYVAGLDATSQMHMAPNGVPLARAVAKDLDAHTSDQTIIATAASGNVTAADLAKWLAIFPAAARAQLPTGPDSLVPSFVRNIVRNEMMLHQADSVHIVLDTSETNGIRKMYTTLIADSWTRLGVDPKVLADSAKTPADRERLAAAHVDQFLDHLFGPTPSVRFVDVPQPLENVLRGKYESDVSETGLDRAMSRATELRRQADSTRTSKEPPTAIPLPGGGSGPGKPPASPAPSAPAPKP